MRIVIFLSIVLLFSCNNQTSEQAAETRQTTETEVVEQKLPVEAISFSGQKLYRRKVDSTKLEKYSKLIDEFDAIKNPTEEDYLNLGYNYATIFQFKNAIDAYSKGLKSNPNSYKLLRHRAHRLLSTRKVNPAITDLERAVDLIANSSKEAKEYYPNGKVKGTYEYWIWYHLGIGHYLNENFTKAREAFSNCLRLSITAKNKVGAVDWLYNTYLKAGQPDKAKEIVDAYTIEEGLDLNYPYSQRVMFYKGDKTLKDFEFLNKPASEWNGVDMTVAYGLGHWHTSQGEQEKGTQLFNKIIKLPYWNAWAYLLTDKELAKN